LIYFYKGKMVDRVHGLWTAQGWSVHRGPHSGRRPKLTEARPSGRSRARRLAVEALVVRGQHGNPSGGLTLGGEAARWASGGGEQSTAAVIGVERLGARIGGKERSGERGVERQRRGAFYRVGRRWRGGEKAGSDGVLIPSVSNEVRGRGGGVTSLQWGSDGGRAALRFGSPRVEEGAASGGTRRGNSGWAGGGGSGVRSSLAKWAGLAAGLAKCFRAKIKDLNRWASDLIFDLISRILSLKSNVSNISNWILN
jgi:hypothetical protein